MGFGKDGKGVIIREVKSQALGTLASSTGIIIGSPLGILERFRMLKSEIIASFVAITGNEGVGLALYLVDGDISLVEFEQSLETDGPLGPNDSVQEAIADRFSVLAGVYKMDETATEGVFANEHNGGMLVIKPRWTFSRTKSWNWIVYNHGTSLTTGSSVKLKCKNFGVWVT